MIDVAHPILGQEPFAVVEGYDQGVDSSTLERLIIDRFGHEYALGGVLTLSQLGLSTWPLNATGKVMKIEVKAAVASYLRKEAQ